MAAPNSYEEQRRRQVEENKRKLEELRLHNLSAAVRQAAAKPMPIKPLKPRNPRGDAPIRRSGRIARLSDHNEKDELPNPLYATYQERAYAITKAEELKDQLGPDHPTFIKPMSHGHATKYHTLSIPTHFRQYLPVHDEMIVLVDELNNEFGIFCRSTTKGEQHYLTRWKGFAAHHKLADGDCLVFQLIERRKFKVYIIRASSYNKNDH